MERIINRFKNKRKQDYLTIEYANEYAFVGIGNHSIYNLYPVLDHLRVPVKYIVTHSQENAALIDTHFPNVIGTNDVGKVLSDSNIAGVFVCTNPKSHFDLIKQILARDKSVFVEKPPCQNLAELQELIEIETQSKGFCLVGMQKRYAPINKPINKKVSRIISYHYRYLTGLYPEGDSLLDLFIHPLDLISHLFGDYTIESQQAAFPASNKNSKSIFLHLKHDTIIGNIELSTNYSWASAEESLEINTEKGIFKSTNLENLTFENKSNQFLNVPLEKIKEFNQSSTTLFNQNSFMPTLKHNELYTKGYYIEVKTFIDLCEGQKADNLSSLSSLIKTYNTIQQIKKEHYV